MTEPAATSLSFAFNPVVFQVGLGCAHLEEALALLEKAGFVPGMSKLASEIQDGLRELKPHCVIEHLKVERFARERSTVFVWQASKASNMIGVMSARLSFNYVS